jgi:hypothetical protein
VARWNFQRLVDLKQCDVIVKHTYTHSVTQFVLLYNYFITSALANIHIVFGGVLGGIVLELSNSQAAPGIIPKANIATESH